MLPYYYYFFIFLFAAAKIDDFHHIFLFFILCFKTPAYLERKKYDKRVEGSGGSAIAEGLRSVRKKTESKRGASVLALLERIAADTFLGKGA